MEAAARQHDVIAQNLANSQVPGYRRQLIRHGTFESQFDDAMKSEVERQALGTHSGDVVTDFSQGILEQTGSPLDVALQGGGFFVIEGPQGPLYTRNGAFVVNSDGRLVTHDNLPVQGNGGDIMIPEGISPTSVQITEDGRLLADGEEIAQLDLVDFNDRQQLRQVGTTVFQASDGAVTTTAEGRLVQGFRERSNVSPIQELVDLIAAQRRQEAAQKSMTLLSEAVGKHISTQGGI
jgi:flagellar basal body rod protein FlgG